jgi:hypothetical protein
LIGVIGPADSTALVSTVAAEMGLAGTLVVAPYQAPSETGSLVHKLSEFCPVVLFTGRLPYSLAVSAGFHATGFEYIPHEGMDLFRVLNILALSERYRGRIPRLSFDSMPENGVAEAYAELGIEYTCRVIPLEIPAEAGTISTERIIAAHKALYEARDIEHCATCISRVFVALDSAGLPVIRVGHSRMSVRQALLRAQLLLELDRAEASQVAVGLLCWVAAAKNRQRGSPSLIETLRLCAQRLGGRVLREGAKEGSLLTTRGSIERALKLMTVIRSDGPPKEGLVLGIGTGSNAENAEGRAREACERARSGRQSNIRFSEDVVVPFALVHSVQAREIRRTNVQSTRDLQVSPTVVRRLGLIFRELDPAGFTAEEFARGYNIQPRSARRLIALLRARGLVQECGLEAGDGVGRPRHVYRLLLDRLSGLER